MTTGDIFEYDTEIVTSDKVDFGPSMDSYLKERGLKGWELVSLQTDMLGASRSMKTHYFIFKRKIIKSKMGY